MQNLLNLLGIWIATLSLLGNIAQWAYHKYDRYFLFIQKIIRTAHGQFIDYDFTGEYEGTVGIDIINTLDNHFRNRFNQYRKSVHNNTSLIATFDGWQVKIYVEELTQANTCERCCVSLLHMNATHWNAKHLLKNAYSLLRDIQEKVGLEVRNYSLRVIFQCGNPYMNSGVRGINPDRIKSMICVVTPLEDTSDASITITPEHISIGSPTLDSVYQLAESIVSFQRI